MGPLFSLEDLPTPCYAVDEAMLERNVQILRRISRRTGCKILLAQKAFSMFALYPLIGKYLDGTAASGLFEAKLGHECMGKENHIYSPAYREGEFGQILNLCDHIVFNSFAQLEKYKTRVLSAGRECGVRVNPECSTQRHAIYDPCAPFSRLGAPASAFGPGLLNGVSGLHFHTLCEQDFGALDETLRAVEEKFGTALHRMKWLNLGGGHHITREDYDVNALVGLIDRTQQKYGLTVYLEPGEAVALNAGVLICSVLDTIYNGMDIAILDASAACHMPDVLEMPYRPQIRGAGAPGEKPHTYRLGGPTCLAGDIVGDYSFDRPLHPGDRLAFLDMAHYTMVKNNTFNGMNLPAIAVINADGSARVIRSFGYADFRGRLS